MTLEIYFKQCVVIFLITKCSSEKTIYDFLQPDTVDELDSLYNGDVNNISCTRECREEEVPRTCYYHFVVEQYSALNVACGKCPDNITDCYNPGCITVDGVERVILTVNRRIPGPSIQVCLGDRIIVDVVNSMPGKQIAIHWHGLHMVGTPYMDGVPMVTQCSILSDQTFRYDFTVSNSGTFFWHSHDGFQKMDGVIGSLIVREPRSSENNNGLYDYDLPNHVIVVMDWYHTDSDDHFPGLLTRDRSQDAQAFLIAGRGRNHKTSNGFKYPLSIFRVKQHKKYRFRLVGALCSECPVRIKFENHQMLVITTDGKPIKPILVDSVVLEAGIRFDVVIHADKEKSSYWIRAQGLAQCAWFDVQQLSILQYEDSETSEPTTTPVYMPYLPESKVSLLHINSKLREKKKYITFIGLDIMKNEPDMKLIQKFDMYYFSLQKLFDSGNYYKYQQPQIKKRQLAGEINNISSSVPSSPLLSQEDDIPSSVFCPTSSNGSPYCLTENCHCVHMIQVPLDAIVQIVLVDQSQQGSINHPFHLHGYSFALLEMGNFENGKNLEHVLQEISTKPLNETQHPPFVDTVAVPNQGYAIIRFKADNPGFWLFHCHIQFHHETGMFTILKVGNRSQFPAVPDGFPRCGNYIPKLSRLFNLPQYLQPNEVDRSAYLNPTQGGNICARDCEKDPSPKICYYEWTIENYATLGDACGNCTRNESECYNEQCIPSDGFERGMLSINRMYPGPGIQVCIGDRIIVDIKNNMAARTTAMHWHGVFQEDSKFMDGVPMVTQCAIREGTTFRYDFLAGNEGTHFYHSHDGLQKLDGLEGNLVIRTNRSIDPNGLLYDYDLPEHVVFVSDWLHLDADQRFPGLHGKYSGQDADSFLINGHGRTEVDGSMSTTPYAKIEVMSNNRYRLRIVAGLCTVCGAQISIQGHKMLVIATDGNPVAPTRVDYLVLYSGERYDVVLEANQAPGQYWIHIKGLSTCVSTKIYQLGILQYEDANAQNQQLSADPGYEGFQLQNPR
ncbi:hypothetical protein L9F63_001218, partial [Diploptera punctata]